MSWNYVPAVGTKGGILVGMKTQVFEMSSWQPFNFCAALLVKNLRDNFIWRLIVVYGSAYDEHKLDFLNELHLVMGMWQGPTLVGGDFNLIRSQKEKNKGPMNFQMTNSFNNFIKCWGLLEIKDPSRTFTWSNNQVELVMEVLDTTMVNVEWDSKYPLANSKIMPRETSDHNPIRISFGERSNKQKHVFRFGKWWLEI
jgi:hypothetical protein